MLRCRSVAIAGVSAFVLSGCLYPIPYPRAEGHLGKPVFSPDGKQVAYVQDDSFEAGYWTLFGARSELLTWGLHSWKNMVYWGSSANPREKSFAISADHEWVSGDGGGNTERGRAVQFSPDGRRLACLTWWRLVVLDSGTAEVVQRIKVENCLDWRWQSPSVLMWCQKASAPDEVCILRWNVSKPDSAPQEVARWPAGGPFDEAQWSPNGRYMVIRKPWNGRGNARLRVLDLQTGRTHDIDPEDDSIGEISWRTDESGMMVPVGHDHDREASSPTTAPAGERRLWEKYYQRMRIIELPSGKADTWDVPVHPAWGPMILSPVWMGGNRLVLMSTGYHRTTLFLDPAARRVIEPPEGPEAWNHFFACLTEHSLSTASPDLTQIADFDWLGRLRVRPLKLPPLPASGPMTQPARREGVGAGR